MSKLFFSKYQGAGNDFILIDNRGEWFDPALVPTLCHRRFGVGADGVILLQEESQADFRMCIYNSDGSRPDFCGNGLRCFLRFIADLGFPEKRYAINLAEQIFYTEFRNGKIAVEMQGGSFQKHLIEDHVVYRTDIGVPHAVLFSSVDFSLAPFFRNHPLFAPSGTNVHFATIKDSDSIAVRTFERGVEGETFACGSGAVAVGWIACQLGWVKSPIQICFCGGQIEIQIDESKIFMVGDAQKVFTGVCEIISNSVK